jgi:hypothetical protein
LFYRAVELLWIDRLSYQNPKDYLQQYWKELVENRNIFLTASFVKQTIAFAKGQIAQFENNPKQYKKIYNAIRLLYQAKRVAQGKQPKIFLKHNSKKRETIMEIRRSINEQTLNTKKQELSKFANSIMEETDKLKPWKLPDDVNEDWIEDWIIRIRTAHYQHKYKV